MDINIDRDWSESTGDFRRLDQLHRDYVKQLHEVRAKQRECLREIERQRRNLKLINDQLKRCIKTDNLRRIAEEAIKREERLRLFEATLPRRAGKYLQLIIGNVDVGFLTQEAKFSYKQAYEQFKLACLLVAFVLIVANMTYSNVALEKLHLFYLSWYYCAVTLRESVLRANGSKIRGWWRWHHALSIAASLILFVWPKNGTWSSFKPHFLGYSLYNCLVQYLQFNYQKSALYRLRALGQKDNMAVTVEGFQHWMWRDLAFLLPFLLGSYIYQLYNAVKLYEMTWQRRDATWHVTAICLLMFVFFVGNTVTTSLVVVDKLKNRRKLLKS